MARNIQFSYKRHQQNIPERGNHHEPRSRFIKISYGLYIVTSGQDGKFNGQIANSIVQATSEWPPRPSASTGKLHTYELIQQSRKFIVSIISEAAPMTFIGLFGFKSGQTFDKLKDVKTKTGVTGVPIVWIIHRLYRG